MPVKQFYGRSLGARAGDLLARLVQEWRSPDSSLEQPLILEKQSAPGRPREVYVVWDEWESLSEIDRSEVVTDAFEQRYGRDRAMELSVAMGLTTSEAKRMGFI